MLIKSTNARQTSLSNYIQHSPIFTTFLPSVAGLWRCLAELKGRGGGGVFASSCFFTWTKTRLSLSHPASSPAVIYANVYYIVLTTQKHGQ